MIALIPARAGSTRCPGKNLRTLNGHPLVAYTMAAAWGSGCFTDVLVCADDEIVLEIGRQMGCAIQARPRVPDRQADIVWVRDALAVYPCESFESFAILRPTSPFRTAETIRRAVHVFHDRGADSLRAVEPVSQTPYKMWVLQGQHMVPLLEGARDDGVPYHSCPSQDAPRVYRQNSSLEMAWSRNVTEYGTIHGRRVAPFFTIGAEGLSIDTEADWDAAVAVAAAHPALLPPVGVVGVSPLAADDDTSDTCWAV